jgi:hypothetical protein
MQMHRDIRETAPYCGYGADVIEMRVREPDSIERNATRFHHGDDLVAFIAGINQYSMSRLVVNYEICVLTKRSNGA